jgi:CubicO group peptidase (beta-lactamase class C family)
MYEALSHLHPVLLNTSFEAYVEAHLFAPLNMSSSTYSVAKAEAENLAEGFQWNYRDFTKGYNGTLMPTIPYFLRPKDAEILAGAGGVFSSARDLVCPVIWYPIPC